MYVGVILYSMLVYESWNGIPHVCGGDPLANAQKANQKQYSPCMWG